MPIAPRTCSRVVFSLVLNSQAHIERYSCIFMGGQLAVNIMVTSSTKMTWKRLTSKQFSPYYSRALVLFMVGVIAERSKISVTFIKTMRP